MGRIREMFRDRRVFSWALYDWANSVFATTVMAGFFPVFFKQYWSAETDAVVSTAQLGFANSIASVFILIAAPILGAIADGGGARKKYLGVFTALGIVMAAGLYFVAQGDWAMAALVYVLATVGFSGGIVFYDALIMSVSSPDRYDEVSCFGYSLGYIGGGMLFAINVAMVLSPATFGIPDSAAAVQISFLTVAVWWLVILHSPVPQRPGAAPDRGHRLGGRDRAPLAREDHPRAPHPPDGGSLPRSLLLLHRRGPHHHSGWPSITGSPSVSPDDSLIVALLIVQFVGFPAALVYGFVARRVGPKPTLYFGVVVYVAVTIYAYFMTSVIEFYILAVVIGLVQGGVQAVSRSLYARFVPAAQSGEFFGFFNMLGRFAAIIGPSLVAITGLLTGSSRLGILSVIVVLVIGAVLLTFVREQEEAAPAAA